jgi:CubicO group peptidase (beta-lactamase class C family)
MTQTVTEVDPAEVGFDATRLERINRHFRRYVDDGRLPGWSLLVSRYGRIAHAASYGQRDLEAGTPIEADTLFRIYSMTKPITSVAAMMLYEEGAFELTDPVSRYIPSFADQRVLVGGTATKPVTVPATEPVRIWHLLTHTAGLTYGFHHVDVGDELYRQAGFEWASPAGLDLEGVTDAWASLPLLFQPGTEWNYSVATDVVGRLVEVVSGLSLADFFAERIFEPLGMVDTSFALRPGDEDRLAALYARHPKTGQATRQDVMGRAITHEPRYYSGGGGLLSTRADYHRFTQLLLNRGELDGVRLLGDRTVRYMASNHLPGGADLEAFGRPLFAESPFTGTGFGLGFSVLLDPVAGRSLGSAGEFAWGGAASNAFWVDPAEQLTAVFLTQLMPSNTYPIRSQLRQLVYSALVDRA